MPESFAARASGASRIPTGAWIGWATGALGAIGAIAFSYFTGDVDAGGASEHLGMVCGILGASLGLMGALGGAFSNRSSAAR